MIYRIALKVRNYPITRSPVTIKQGGVIPRNISFTKWIDSNPNRIEYLELFGDKRSVKKIRYPKGMVPKLKGGSILSTSWTVNIVESYTYVLIFHILLVY